MINCRRIVLYPSCFLSRFLQYAFYFHAKDIQLPSVPKINGALTPPPPPPFPSLSSHSQFALRSLHATMQTSSSISFAIISRLHPQPYPTCSPSSTSAPKPHSLPPLHPPATHTTRPTNAPLSNASPTPTLGSTTRCKNFRKCGSSANGRQLVPTTSSLRMMHSLE